MKKKQDKNVSGWFRKIAMPVCMLAWATAPAMAQSGAKNGEWRTYGGDLGNTHYSPLDQINAANFGKLRVAWRFKTENLGPRPEYNLEGTPLIVNGVMYCHSGHPPRRGCARCGYGRIAVGTWRARRRPRRCLAAPALGPRTWRIGPMAAKNASYMSPSATVWWLWTPKPAIRSRASATTASSI